MEQELNIQDQILAKLKANLLKAQNNMKAYAGRHRIPHPFYGPYRIIKCIGDNAFELNLPQGSKIHPVFHTSKFKLWLPPLYIENKPQVVPTAILASKIEGHPPREYVLVQWQGLYPKDSTWELLTELLHDYSDLHLEGKTFSHQEGDDMTHGNEEQYNNKQGYEKPNRKKKKSNWMKDFVTDQDKRKK